jgi:hypothetical protein
MTFQTPAFAVDGNAESGNFLRLMLQSSSQGAQGVIGALDLVVGPTTPTATAGIVIQPGAMLILGVETPYQGTYYAYNVGTDTTLSIAATGGSARSDMIVARVEDPTWSGTPWGGPASGQIVFPRVISGVSSSATTMPGGQSGIPLARIDMPASTSTVQAAYIHDLRNVAQPQRLMQVIGAQDTTTRNWTVGTAGVIWPPAATWSVFIPSWATILQLGSRLRQPVLRHPGQRTQPGHAPDARLDPRRDGTVPPFDRRGLQRRHPGQPAGHHPDASIQAGHGRHADRHPVGGRGQQLRHRL